jgi:hypothetical protein
MLEGKSWLKAVTGVSDLWEIDPANCALKWDCVSFWFEVTDTRPGSHSHSRVLVTDPLTFTPDWRLQETDNEEPASVVFATL